MKERDCIDKYTTEVSHKRIYEELKKEEQRKEEERRKKEETKKKEKETILVQGGAGGSEKDGEEERKNEKGREEQEKDERIWKRIGDIPKGVRETIYLYRHEKLLTNERMKRIDKRTDDRCKRKETAKHVFSNVPKELRSKDN